MQENQEQAENLALLKQSIIDNENVILTLKAQLPDNGRNKVNIFAKKEAGGQRIDQINDNF